MDEFETTYRIIGAAIAVHRDLGPGLLEAIYHEALMVEFDCRGIPYRSQPAYPLRYRGRALRRNFFPDFIVEDSVVVEIKSVQRLAPVHLAQALSYLRLTGLHLGLLINFTVPALRLGVQRVSL